MPSDKRARQRALREIKLAEEQRHKKRVRMGRRLLGALAVIAIVIVFIVLLSGGSPKKPATTTTTTTAVTTTTIKAAPAIAPVCPPATPGGAPKRVIAFTKAPPQCVTSGATYQATVVTDVGSFVIKLPVAASPAAVNNFVFLARYHFFDGTIFHRVIPGFVVQGGDPTGTGTGGPGYSFTGNTPPKSCTAAKDCYPIGGVAMANSSGPSTDGSQFFMVLPGGQVQLDSEPNYTLFGEVTSGMSVVEKIGSDGTSGGTPKVVHHIVKVTISEIAS